MGTRLGAFFQITTMIISIPSVVLITSLIISLWGGSIRFTRCLFRFRQAAHPKASHRGLSPTLPVIAIGLVVIGDAVVLAAAALPAWINRTSPPMFGASSLEVRVIAEQFAWNIHYPGPDRRFGPTRAALINASNPIGVDRRTPDGADDLGLQNLLTVPLGRPVIVHLSSRDVVHSFTLNEMRIRHDATPGLVTRTWFTPTVIGRWEIACSQLCGLAHYRMRGSFAVVAAADWQTWQAREVARLQPATP